MAISDDKRAWLSKIGVKSITSPAGRAATPVAASPRGGSGGGGDDTVSQDVAKRLAAKLKAGADLSTDIIILSRVGMPKLLDILDRLKAAGVFEDLADQSITDPRLGIAILTVRGDFDSQWQALLPKLNDTDRKAILARAPKDLQLDPDDDARKKPDAKKKEGDDDAPEGSVVVDPLKKKIDTEIEVKFSYRDSSGRRKKLPVKVTLHFGGNQFDGLEAELALLSKKLQQDSGGGIISDVTISVGIGAELTLDRDTANRVTSQFAAKLKATLTADLRIPGTSIKIPIEISVSVGPDGKPSPAANFTVFKF